MRIAVRVIGLVIFAGSLYYLADQLSEHLDALSAFELGWATVVGVGALALGYALALLLVSTAWGVLLSGALARRLLWAQVTVVYGRSQVLKYVPSDVMHFAGRQVLGGRRGWPQFAIATASILEILSQVTASGALVALLGWSILLSLFPNLPPALLVAGLLAALAVIWIVLYAAPGLPVLSGRANLPDFRGLARGRSLPLACLLQAAFQLICGVMLWALIASFDDGVSWSGIPAVCAAYSAAWVVGFVSPGVSAGVGVREAILVLLLGPVYGETTAVAAALAMRVVTTAGDLVLFGAATILGNRTAGDGEVGEADTPTTPRR